MLINGHPRDSVPAGDRGLQYGDGLFETLAVVAGQPCLWKQHLARLAAGCRRLGIPPLDWEQLAVEAQHLVANQARAVLKILVTRGSGGRGYRPPQGAEPTRILSVHPMPDYPADWRRAGVRVRLCQTRLGMNPGLAGIKHLNRLEQVMARAEWNDPEIAEGLMRDADGHWVAGTQTNLFLVGVDGRLTTPALARCGVAGVMRGWVLEQAPAHGLPVDETEVESADLAAVRGLFLTNSLIGIWPVRELEGRRYDPDALAPALRSALLRKAFAPGDAEFADAPQCSF